MLDFTHPHLNYALLPQDLVRSCCNYNLTIHILKFLHVHITSSFLHMLKHDDGSHDEESNIYHKNDYNWCNEGPDEMVIWI